MVCRAFDISYLNVGHRKVATRGMKRRLQLEYALIYSNRFLIVALAGSFYRSVREPSCFLFFGIRLFGERDYDLIIFERDNDWFRQKRVVLQHIRCDFG